MPKGDRTKRIRGTDLSHQCFLFVGDKQEPDTWALPVFDPTSTEKTRHLIQRNLEVWEEITNRIPPQHHQWLLSQLLGAAQSFGITPEPPLTVSDEEMDLLLAERFAARMLRNIDSLYD